MRWTILTLLLVVSPTWAGPNRPHPTGDEPGNPWQWTEEEGGYWWKWKLPQAGAVVTSPGEETPMAAVNARRARTGLPPFVEDPLLSQAAQAAAEYRAANLIEGHVGGGTGDFSFLPSGAVARAAGCAAWPPHLGWGSCCMEDRCTYAGAGWAMGRDGRRYMHLFVR